MEGVQSLAVLYSDVEAGFISKANTRKLQNHKIRTYCRQRKDVTRRSVTIDIKFRETMEAAKREAASVPTACNWHGFGRVAYMMNQVSKCTDRPRTSWSTSRSWGED